MVRWRFVLVGCALLAISAPNATAATWVSSGPSPAQIDAIGLDPGQPGLIYVGTGGGAVLRSTDAGTSWQRTGATGDDRIAAIAVHGSEVLVSSAGEAFSGVGGILRSFDGGATWSSAGTAQGIANTDVGPVAIDPSNPDIMLLGTNGGLFRSTDAGGSWAPVAVPSGVQISDVLFDPAQTGVVYVSTSNQGVSRSTDHGGSFANYNQPTEFGKESVDALALDGSELYAGGFFRAIKTPTSGIEAAWSEASEGLGSEPEIEDITAGASMLYAALHGGIVSSRTSFVDWSASPTPGFRVGRVIADPAQPTRLYAAGDGLARSLDGGASWQRIDAAIPGLGTTMVAAVTPGSALVVTATGLQRTDDLGASFALSTAGLLGSPFNGPVVDPANPARTFVFTNSGLYGSEDGGRSWTPRNYGSSNYDGAITVAPSNDQVMYAAGFSGAVGSVRRSTDGGQIWTDDNSAGAAFNFASGIAVDAADAEVAYLSTSEGLRVTGDGGTHWSPVGGGLPTGRTGIVVADPATPSTAYVISSGTIWRSSDRAVSWHPTAALPTGVPSDLLVDPQQPATLYAATDHGVFRSQDTGASWQAFSDGLPNMHVHSLSIDRAHAALYAATDAGLAVASLLVPGPLPGSATTPPATTTKVRPTPTAPSIARHIVVDLHGVAHIHLSCPRTALGGCAGKLTLVTRPPKARHAKHRVKAIVLGSGPFSLTAGKTLTLRVRLHHLKLSPGRSLTVDATLYVGARTLTTAVTLQRAAKPKHRAKRH